MSINEDLVLERLNKLRDEVGRTTVILDGKIAMGLKINLFVTAVLFFLAFFMPDGWWEGELFIYTVLEATWGILIFTSLVEVLRPPRQELPGTIDWEVLTEKYLNITPVECYTQTVSDLINSIKDVRRINSEKREWLAVTTGLLLFQAIYILGTLIVCYIYGA